ncbi:hypothetical protein RHMOL_Rhmol11G0214800 [Rhododendron molle]|uniref:Uncharacterized protein n=1 Tax=Rhododendron molle TaxID=49168 RepID=A0ACC0LW09_RHOML|nr:hypothetical protein RHMOL_Rhmol11G0214800 [Rhododendron molle]
MLYIPLSREYKNIVQIQQGRDPSEIQRQEFAKWFKRWMNDLRSEGSSKATDELWSLANGPGSIIDLYSGCISNGVRFHTRDRESRRRCQNSGLVVEGNHKGMNINFYGYLCKIWELRYLHGGTVVLFECEWYNTGQRSRIYNDECVTSIDFSRLWYKDDPFVLPSQQDEPTDVIPILAGDTNISYNKDDVDPEIVGDDELMEDHIDDNNDRDDTLAEYADDEEDELNRQPDFDNDLDIDCDI